MSLSILRFSFSNSSGLVASVGFDLLDLDVLFPGVTFGAEGAGGMPDDITGTLSAEEVEDVGDTEEAQGVVEVAGVEVTTDRDTGHGRKG